MSGVTNQMNISHSHHYQDQNDEQKKLNNKNYEIKVRLLKIVLNVLKLNQKIYFISLDYKVYILVRIMRVLLINTLHVICNSAASESIFRTIIL